MAGQDTPATRAARAAGIDFTLHSYTHDPAAQSYGLEAAHALGVEPDRVFKTLLALLSDKLLVCIVPVEQKLALRALGKHAVMAPPAQAERVTGYVVGGISPLGQKRRLPTFLDDSAAVHATILVSAGRRGLEIELAPDDLLLLTGGELRGLTSSI